MGLGGLTKNSIIVIGCRGESQHMEEMKRDTRYMVSRELSKEVLPADLVGSQRHSTWSEVF